MSKVHQALKRLVLKHGERGEPIAFAGREDILGRIGDVATLLKEGPSEGQTFVIGGAPGAGKTSLVRESVRRLKAQGIDSVVCPSPSSDGDIDALVWRIASMLTGVAKETLQGMHRRRFSGSVSVAELGSVSGSYESEPREPTLRSFDDLSLLTNKPPINPVVVFIDEAQNIGEHSKAAALVNSLHTQYELPALLVCAGLATTYDRLNQAGLTRPADDHVLSLGLLARADTVRAAGRALRVIMSTGVEGGQANLASLTEAIAIAADDWPRHLTCYLRGVCEALLEQGTPSFLELDIDNVLERGDRLRQSYYENRLVSSELPARIVADLYADMDSRALTRDACEDILEQAIQGYGESGAVALRRRFPTGKVAFEKILGAGLLTVQGNASCRIPIPSMETFVLEKGGKV